MSEDGKRLVDQIESEVIPSADNITQTGAADQSLLGQIEKTRTRKKSYVMDLRIHSPASLGYLAVDGIDTAPALVRLAKVKGLDVIAVTDFYSAAFVDRIKEAARDTSLTIIPGVDLRCVLDSCDDVIISCLFPEQASTQELNSFLAALAIPESVAGQAGYIVNRPFDEILKMVDARGAVALPSRMDKTPHRIAVVPALVERYGFRAFDLAYSDSAAFFRSRWPKLKFQLFSFSNANALAQVGSRTARVKMPDPGFAGIRQLVARVAQIEPVTARV